MLLEVIQGESITFNIGTVASIIFIIISGVSSFFYLKNDISTLKAENLSMKNTNENLSKMIQANYEIHNQELKERDDVIHKRISSSQEEYRKSLDSFDRKISDVGRNVDEVNRNVSEIKGYMRAMSEKK